MWNEFYRFDDAARSFVALRPDAPAPWINYLSNGSMHAFVSQAGGGFAWWKSPVIFRLSRYRQYNLPIDSPGFYVYIKPAGAPAWSPTWRPTCVPLDRWIARHQPGRTTFEAEKDGLKASLTFFVAPDYDVLVWDLRLSSSRREAVEVDVTPYVELSQLLWQEETCWGYYVKHMLKTWREPELDAVVYLDHHRDNPRLDEVPLVYLASSESYSSYAGDRDAFMGRYRDERNPLGVEQCDCGDSSLHTGEPCAALMHKLSLKPGGEKRMSFFLGVAPSALKRMKQAKARAAADLAVLRSPGGVDAQLAKSGKWWSEHLRILDCDIPDKDAQRQINTWTPVNCVHTGRYSRSVNTAAPGIRGLGFRDSCQDMLAVAYRRPDWATDVLRVLMANQYVDGHVVHAMFPEERRPPWTSIHSDDHLWLPLLAHAIVAETGDAALLSERVAYLGDDHKPSGSSGSVWEHLLACVKFTESRLGVHKIPLTLKSDWNDIIGKFALKGRGESVFAAQQYVYALRLLIETAEFIGDSERRGWLEDCLKRQVDALLACAWDGSWWRRGFDDDGNPYGAKDSPFGKLFLNSQSWAVLAGVGSMEQLRKAMDEVGRQLETGVGLKKINPGFKTWPDVEDPFSCYGPGTGENGAVFCHANTWAIMAEALLRDNEKAWRYFTQLVPHKAIQKVGVERYQAEPYAWCSSIVGPENLRFGWATVSQISGTAAWMDVAATQYLLGLRPTIKGMLIDPCVPKEWKVFNVSRLYRGCEMRVEVRNVSGEGCGVKRLSLDGKPLDCAASPLVPATAIAGRSMVKIVAEL